MSAPALTTAPVTAAEAAIAAQFGATIGHLAQALQAITRTDIDLREATAQLSDAAYELDEAVLAAADGPTIRPEVLETAVADLIRALCGESPEVIGTALIERDLAEDKLNRMTHAVARLLDADFGEHTPTNDPWTNALDALHDAVGVSR